MTSSKWYLPALAVALGIVICAAQAIGGHAGSGFVSLGIMVVFGAAILLGSRSETVRGLRGDGRDERFREIDTRATAIAGVTVISAVIIAFVVEVARGHSGAPYTWLGAVAGVSYVAAVAVLRVRR